jgi:alkanesulfonate monooxygenase SsuD/methylene tetrahydromethanopterin reductase-like flavin-dependent oxidoreductase (luciferase family)
MTEAREKIDQWAREAGRDGAQIEMGLQLWYAVDDDRDVARGLLARRMEGFYQIPFERFERYSPYGRPEEIAQFLAPYVEAGCRHVNLVGAQRSQDEVVQAALAVKEELAKVVGE